MNRSRFPDVVMRSAHLRGAVLMVAVMSMLAPFHTGAQISGETWGDDAIEPVEQLTAENCARFELDPDSAGPLEKVSLADWPEVETLFRGVAVIRLESAGIGDDDAPVLRVNQGPDRYTFRAPLHPSGDPEGGEVEVRFGHVAEPASEAYMDSVQWCEETVSLLIEALPAADDPERGLDAHLSQLEQLYETAVRSAGMELSEFVDLPRDEVPAEHALLYAGSRLLRDERGVHSLIRDMDEIERELVDRLLIQSVNVRESRNDLRDDEGFVPVAGTQLKLRHRAPVPRQEAEPHAPTASPGVLERLAQVLFQSAHAGSSADTALPEAVKGECRETDFDELSRLLGRQISGNAMLSGDPADFLETVTFFAGLPGLGKLGGDVIVLMSWMTRTVAEKLAYTYPDPALNRSGIQLAPQAFLEDSTEMGQVEEMRVRFHSRGWDAGPRMAELGMIVANKVGAKAMEKFVMTSRGAPDNQGYVFELLGDVYWESGLDEKSAKSVNEFLIETVLWTAEEVSGIDPDETELLQDRSLTAVEADCWEVVSEPPHWNARIDFQLRGDIEVGTRRGEFRPASVGFGDVFGTWEFEVGQHAVAAPWAGPTDQVVVFRTEAHQVEIKPLVIKWLSSRPRARPGEEVELRLRVDQAHDGTVEITDSLGQVHTRHDASEETTFSYLVPDDWDGEDPIEITALSLSTDGLRSPTHSGYAGARWASHWVLLDRARPRPVIVPAKNCLEPGSRLTLEVVDASQEDIPLEVNWSAEGGTIGPDGTLHVPMEPGELEVTATPVDSPEAATTASFEVRDCSACSWTLQIDGETHHGEEIGLVFIDRESGGIRYIVLREHNQVFDMVTGAGHGSDASYTVGSNPARIGLNPDGSYTPYRIQLSLEWSQDSLRDGLPPGVNIRGSGSGAATVKFKGRFHSPVYRVGLRSPDMLDREVREQWFANAEAGDMFWYFDREASMLECGGRARERLERHDHPTWPDHQVPLHGYK